MNMYEVIDRKTGEKVGTYKTLRTAKKAADRLDNIYGAYRYKERLMEEFVEQRKKELNIQ